MAADAPSSWTSSMAGNLLDTRFVSGFINGLYLVWNLSGRVIVRFTNTNPSSNAVMSGLFFR